MPQPVKLSDPLVQDARLTGEASARSLAGQIEFWAGLGRAVEKLLGTEALLKLRSRGLQEPLSACLAGIDTSAGRTRLAAYLAARPFPHFEAYPEDPKLVLKVDEDGTRTLGRMVRRQFRAVRGR
jgi:hypothetical protein